MLVPVSLSRGEVAGVGLTVTTTMVPVFSCPDSVIMLDISEMITHEFSDLGSELGVVKVTDVGIVVGAVVVGVVLVSVSVMDAVTI